MKVLFAFALLIAGISAWPHQPHGNHFLSNVDWKNERLISDTIAARIQGISNSIKAAGLDPVDIEKVEIAYSLPVEVLFGIELVVEKLHSIGLSNIVINNISYALLTSRLTFDIELPHIAIGGQGGMSVRVFGSEGSVSVSGGVEIVRVRVAGNVRVSIGIFTGISVRSVDVSFTLQDIKSDLNVNILGVDISDFLNTLLGSTIPNKLNEFSKEINELIEIVITEFVENNF